MAAPSATTVVPAVVIGFQTQAQNAVPTGVDVVLGDPGLYVANGLVIIEGWEIEEPPAGIGQGLPWQVDEIGHLLCMVRSWTGDGAQTGQTASFTGAFDIFNAVQGANRNDPSIGGVLGGASYFSYISVAAGKMGIPPSDKGRATQIDFSLYFRGRINLPPA